MSRYIGTPLGYQQLSVPGTAVGFTVPSGAERALVICEAGNVRWRDDGPSPTASVGMPMALNGVLSPYDGNLSGIKFISQSGTATLSISYYGAGAFNA